MITHFDHLVGSIFSLVLHEIEFIMYVYLPALLQLTIVTFFTSSQSRGWRNCRVGRGGESWNIRSNWPFNYKEYFQLIFLFGTNKHLFKIALWIFYMCLTLHILEGLNYADSWIPSFLLFGKMIEDKIKKNQKNVILRVVCQMESPFSQSYLVASLSFRH